MVSTETCIYQNIVEKIIVATNNTVIAPVNAATMHIRVYRKNVCFSKIFAAP